MTNEERQAEKDGFSLQKIWQSIHS